MAEILKSILSIFEMISYEDLIVLNFLIFGALYAYMKLSSGKGRDNIDLYSALGFKAEMRPSKVIVKKDHVTFSRIPPIAMSKDFWTSKFGILSGYFNDSVIDVEIFGNNARNTSAKLIFDRIPESFTVDFNKIKLSPMEIFLGINQYGKEVKFSLMDSASIYIDGKPGSGKSVALKTIIESYLRSFGNEIKENPIEVVVVTTKIGDFTYLKKREGISLTLVDIFDSEIELSDQCDFIINSLSELKEAQKEFNQTIERLALSDAGNLEKLRQKGEDIRFPRRIYIFDEAKDYLSKEKGDSKEEAEAKQRLIKAIGTHLRRNARFLSIPVIVAAQVQNENDLDISLKSFHLRFCSNTNEAMSRQLSGSSLLTDPSFTKGKFYLKTQRDEHILRVSLVE